MCAHCRQSLAELGAGSGLMEVKAEDGLLVWSDGDWHCDPDDAIGFDVAARPWDSSAPQQEWIQIQLAVDVLSVPIEELTGDTGAALFQVSRCAPLLQAC